MAGEPTLLFIHGVRYDDSEREWLKALDDGLRGTEGIEARGVKVISPSYLRLLDSAEPEPIELKPTYKAGDDAAYAAAGLRYWSSLRSLEEAGVKDAALRPTGKAHVPADGMHANAMRKLLFEQAKRYCESERRRKKIFETIIDELPRRGDLVIIAHSLGSVVAADLVYYLPPRCRLRLVITIGSPLAMADAKTSRAPQGSVPL